jgi:hypothetical protein
MPPSGGVRFQTHCRLVDFLERSLLMVRLAEATAILFREKHLRLFVPVNPFPAQQLRQANSSREGPTAF